MAKRKKPEVVEAEVVEVLEDIAEDVGQPNFDAEPVKTSRKQPRGKRKKDFPSFTPNVRETILQVTSYGTPLKYAAKYAGVKPETVATWLERGERAQERIDDGYEDELAAVEIDFAEFYSNYNHVAATAVSAVLASIMKAAKKNPHVALKLLEKLDPQEFGQRQAIDMNVEGAVRHGHLHVDAKDLVEGGEVAKQLSNDELRRLRANLKQLPAGKEEESEE